ncbi:hypothetical protein [uncultured Roseivirga sp.]|uniref:hypothetical protein n=1 Tax=uncultured Roseivirga sp. TaxID=543088 RepID=UPI0030DC2D5F|tara:strand:+ start:3943 stop:4488 length:546 start_codon:yes stop_codon:yes gene_type:complete
MKSKLEKEFEKFKKEFLGILPEEKGALLDCLWKFKSKIFKMISTYKAEIKSKNEVILNQTDELTRLRLETYLYKSKLRDIQKKVEFHDLKFEGWDHYQLSEKYAKLFNKLPAVFTNQEIELLAMREVGADNDDLETMLWQYENLYLISKKADGSYIKLLDAVPSDLNEIDYIRDRVSLVQN